MVLESVPATKTPDVPTDIIALLPESSVRVAICPTVAVVWPGRMIPEEPAIAERVLVPTTAMAVGDVEVGVGITVGVALELSMNTALVLDVESTMLAIEVEVLTGVDALSGALVV